MNRLLSSPRVELSLVTQKRANIFGLGLIGGSLGLALSSRGGHVTGCDSVGDIERLNFLAHMTRVDEQGDSKEFMKPLRQSSQDAFSGGLIARGFRPILQQIS